MTDTAHPIRASRRRKARGYVRAGTRPKTAAQEPAENIRTCVEFYKKTDNPLWLWMALLVCDKLTPGSAVPETKVILDYLRGVAARFFAAGAQGSWDTSPSAQSVAEIVLGTTARGRGGIGRRFSEILDTHRDFEIAARVHALVLDGWKREAAYVEVATKRDGRPMLISRAHAQRAYAQWGSTLRKAANFQNAKTFGRR